jgi:hypothetical protein
MTSPTAPTTSPLSELDAATLNQAFRAFQADTGLIEIQFDGRALGSHVVVDGERIEIDVVHLKLRDLLFVHALDATRFGTLDQCEICKADA